MKLQRYDASEQTFACPHACWCDKRVDRAAGKPGVDPATGERWAFESLPRCDCPEPLDDVVSPCEGGRLVLAADVDALLARIRAAVAHVVSVAPDWWVDYDYEQGDECRSCGASRDKSGKRCGDRDLAHRDGCQRAALDELLAGGGT